jgi:hypothetical protein
MVYQSSLDQLLILLAMFLPSQGFFNFIVFIRPRYRAVRNNFPERSRRWALVEAVWNPLSKAHGSGDGSLGRGSFPLQENVHQHSVDKPVPANELDFTEEIDSAHRLDVLDSGIGTSCIDHRTTACSEDTQPLGPVLPNVAALDPNH